MSNLESYLILQQAVSLNAASLKNLIATLGSVTAIIEAADTQLAALGLTPEVIGQIKNPNGKIIERECRWAETSQQTILTWEHVQYPSLLKEIYDPPPVIYAAGNINLLAIAQIAIVGSRNPTPMGKEIAHYFACDLAGANLAITSGLALGIDEAAHRGAIEGKGGTVAVLGSGLNHIYPAVHKKLVEEIIQSGGVVISEFSLDTPPRPIHFPRRNRVISGLSLGTVVIEAASRSGSLITARLAMEQNREIFAVPGSIHNPLAKGCHELIRQGAKLVEKAEDILEELKLGTSPPLDNSNNLGYMMHPEKDRLLNYMDFNPVSIDELVYLTHQTASEISIKLLKLELEGTITTTKDGRYIRVKR